jgi:hypothetical protein
MCLLSVPTGLLNGLQARSEVSELCSTNSNTTAWSEPRGLGRLVPTAPVRGDQGTSAAKGGEESESRY